MLLEWEHSLVVQEQVDINISVKRYCYLNNNNYFIHYKLLKTILK